MSLNFKQIARDFCREKGFNNVEYIEEAMRRAAVHGFVAGAKRWEFIKTGATMWPSDQTRMEGHATIEFRKTNVTWIHQSIVAGGTVSFDSFPTGFRAMMTWPHGAQVSSNICKDIDAALTSLDNALMEDAAEEMRQSGAV